MAKIDWPFVEDPLAYALEQKQDAVAREIQLKEAEATINALSPLTEHAGWRLFKGFLEREEKALLVQMAREADPNKLLRLSGALFTLQSCATWRERTLEEAVSVSAPSPQ